MAASRGVRARALAWLSLFTSVGTLVCCALPALLVLLGLGATVASVLVTVPWLVTLSRHKGWVFVVTGLLLAANVVYQRVMAPRLVGADSCPEGEDTVCDTAGRVSRVVLRVSLAIYVVGAIVAYALGPLLMWMSGP